MSIDMKRNILLNTLKGKTIKIIGHDNIDVDAALSGILMSRLLDFLKIPNTFCILEPIDENSETYQIVKELLDIDLKRYVNTTECEKDTLFLVDHYETVHSGNVIGCIDHHPTSQQIHYEFLYIKNSCSTAYLIFTLMQAVQYPLTMEEAKLIIISMMVDTTSFRSSKTIINEVTIAKNLAKQYNIDYDFLEKYCLCLTPIETMSIEEIISNGQKWYNYNGNKVGSSYIQVYGLDENCLLLWLEHLRLKQTKYNAVLLVFIIFDLKHNITYEYQINSSIQEKVHKGILSRGKDIMPLIEKKYI